MEGAQAGIKIAGRNINNLKYEDDITLITESKEELKSLLMKVKEESKSWLITQHQKMKIMEKKMKIMESCPITLWQMDGETMEIVTDFIFFDSKITVDSGCSHEIKRHLFPERKVMTNHIKKQRNYFAYKDPHSQIYGFSSSHIWMCELDSKKG